LAGPDMLWLLKHAVGLFSESQLRCTGVPNFTHLTAAEHSVCEFVKTLLMVINCKNTFCGTRYLSHCCSWLLSRY